ncbi:MAG TPA: DUF475 domain-containing protein [Spirochaetia bacterium]|nr:DUF475 domain-containing protein [Spirochaetia bacterium]
MRSFLRYFAGSTVFALLALGAAFVLGFLAGGTVSAGLSALFTTLMLGVLETSLSFDNAVVNARVLGTLAPFWRTMFLTVGVIIAVFGMRILFPLLVVWAVSAQDFWSVVVLSWADPGRFQTILVDQHRVVAGFGGAFLLMVFGGFFFDGEKEHHWVPGVEPLMGRLGRIPGFPVVLALGATLAVSHLLPAPDKADFLVAALWGIGLNLLVSGLGAVLQGGRTTPGAATAGLGAFLYLETLDASFSFDGVIGAFAVTNSLYLIALGLGTGAFFVRSMTIQLVEQGTLGVLRYLEHGAFWAIGALAALLYLGASGLEVPQVVPGMAGLVLIGASALTSILANRRQKP